MTPPVLADSGRSGHRNDSHANQHAPTLGMRNDSAPSTRQLPTAAVDTANNHPCAATIRDCSTARLDHSGQQQHAGHLASNQRALRDATNTLLTGLATYNAGVSGAPRTQPGLANTETPSDQAIPPHPPTFWRGCLMVRRPLPPGAPPSDLHKCLFGGLPHPRLVAVFGPGLCCVATVFGCFSKRFWMVLDRVCRWFSAASVLGLVPVSAVLFLVVAERFPHGAVGSSRILFSKCSASVLGVVIWRQSCS